MSTTCKSVFDAAQQIGKALDGLSPEDQKKAIDGVVVMLGLGQRGENPPVDRDQDAQLGSSLRPVASQTGGSSEKPLSLVEYKNARQPVTNAQRIAVFAAYREESEGKETFAMGDLEGYFAKAKLAAQDRTTIAITGKPLPRAGSTTTMPNPT